MNRRVAFIGCVMVILFGCVVQAQAQFTIRAAATAPVSGWQRMESPEGNQTVWVAPTPSLTSADIDAAQPGNDRDGRPVVTIRFTEAGSEKMREFSAAQIARPIALVLDGELIWAPVVRSAINAEALITGGPNGLTPEQVQRILASINQR